MNTSRGAGAQFGLEARVRAAVRATAEEIRPDDVPPAPTWLPEESPDASARRPASPGRGGWASRGDWYGPGPGLHHGARRLGYGRWGYGRGGAGRWGVPLAAAAAVVMAAGVTVALTVNRMNPGAGGTAAGTSAVSSASGARPTTDAAAAAAEAAAAKQAAAVKGAIPDPGDLEAGLIGRFVPASGAQYSAGASLDGDYKALESQAASACMARAGFEVTPATPESIARQDQDLAHYPDLGAIAKAGALPGGLVGSTSGSGSTGGSGSAGGSGGTSGSGSTSQSGSAAFTAALQRCGAASDELFSPMVAAGLSLGGPFMTAVAGIQGSAPVLATVPALRACATAYGWPKGPNGTTYQPINSFADFTTWVWGQLDEASGPGAPQAALRKADGRWASVFVQCAQPTVSVMEKLQLTAQRSYLATHKKRITALVALAKADFAQAAQAALG